MRMGIRVCCIKNVVAAILVVLLFLAVPLTASPPDDSGEGEFLSSPLPVAKTIWGWIQLQKNRLDYMRRIYSNSLEGDPHRMEMAGYLHNMAGLKHNFDQAVAGFNKIWKVPYKKWKAAMPPSKLPVDEDECKRQWQRSDGKAAYERYLASVGKLLIKTQPLMIRWNDRWYQGPMWDRNVTQEYSWRRIEKMQLQSFAKEFDAFMTIHEIVNPELDARIATGKTVLSIGETARFKVSILGGTPPFSLEITYLNGGVRKTIKRSGEKRAYTIPIDFKDSGRVGVNVALEDGGEPPQSLTRRVDYNVKAVSRSSGSSRRDAFFGKATKMSQERSDVLDQSFGGAAREKTARRVVAFGIEPKNPDAVTVDASGTYVIPSGRTIEFKAFVTYSDDISSPEDLTAAIEAKNGWVNGPVFDIQRPGIYRVTADFSIIGKRIVRVKVNVR